jgi:hypothetical protein
MARRLPSPLRSLVPALAGAALLAGCGGGGTPAGDGELIGILSDSPVQGVTYLRNGTEAGTTNILGQFRYRAGETLQFRIGKLVLGSLTGSADVSTVTPLELAQSLALADRPDRVTNLLILLQALDVDGDPDGGITIPAAAVAALDTDAEAALLDLDADPAVFLADTDLDAIVTAINTAGGSATKPATVDAALAHFRQQFLSTLAGSYLGTSTKGNPLAVRFRDDGSYLLGEIGATGSGGKAGLERGSIDWDPASGRVTINLPDQDTNDDWGFSYIRTLYSLTAVSVDFRVDNGDLVVSQRDGNGAVTSSYRLPRHYNAGNGFAGTWVKDSATSLQALHLFKRADGIVMAVNPTGDKTLLGKTTAGCNQAGVEFGNYAVGTGFLEFSNISLYDTDGCGGLHDGNLSPGYLIATNAHVLPTLETPVSFSTSMKWYWNSGTQSGTFYRPVNVAP